LPFGLARLGGANEGAYAFACACIIATIALLSVGIAFSCWHGNSAWNGLFVASAPATIEEGGTVHQALIERLAVDRLELHLADSQWIVGHRVTIRSELVGGEVRGAVINVRRLAAGVRIRVELDEPSFKLATVVADGMFSAAPALGVAASVAQYRRADFA
jgi:hypothetical protein